MERTVGKEELPVSFLQECLLVDFETGFLTWKVRPESHFKTKRSCSVWNARYAGKRAGAQAVNGYWHLSVNDRHYYAHRIVVAMFLGEWPSRLVEHRDGVRDNNALENLINSNITSNNRNIRKNARNTSGVNGVFFNRKTGRWTLNKFENSPNKPYLYSTHDFFEAVCARKSYELHNGAGIRSGAR